ncbi:MAG: twin-arginine translocase TatA/TatE family subunit [Armatimonadota bacterium]|nr:twin-arginine translocase TatA/TatE family subunit [Armatimonadota bacterium]MDR7417100.1 twin-arginine translocase TatA/TatE family subunit [Armatimonadota bacterium]MDR7439161.1 twin-arginine translocase TatA/TatE family subunit [Armatimonadota bacterium]MDR7445111.1 twin-arginine translocase TatA/TatE family subunit [Armatimonadota bacterium]MDR7563026.1 twin-arginine translocase TatA/TatE family subunit [Armatimonadota bacterium]
MPFGIGTTELVVILLIALLIFGPSRLAGIGSSLGRAIRDFRRTMREDDEGDQGKA